MLLLPRKVNIVVNLHGTDVAPDSFGVGKTRASSLPLLTSREAVAMYRVFQKELYNFENV